MRLILLLICTWLTRGKRYSTGSSTVIIFLLAWLSSLNAAYSVVVLPLPVGPVTSTMPCGREIWCRIRLTKCSGIPVSSKDNIPADWSSKRITTDSPYCTGMVDIRTSMLWPLIFKLNRPSCGNRFSDISKPAISFKRKTIAEAILFSLRIFSWSTPSIRWRIRNAFSSGSMWTSDARICTASSKTDCNNFPTVASPPSSRKLFDKSKSLLWSYSSSSWLAKDSISAVRRYKPSKALNSCDSITTARFKRFGASICSSWSRALKSAGSLIPISTESPWSSIIIDRKRRAWTSGNNKATSEEILRWLISKNGTSNCCAKNSNNWRSLIWPNSIKVSPSFLPLVFWLFKACMSCSLLIMCSWTSKSPKRIFNLGAAILFS